MGGACCTCLGASSSPARPQQSWTCVMQPRRRRLCSPTTPIHLSKTKGRANTTLAGETRVRTARDDAALLAADGLHHVTTERLGPEEVLRAEDRHRVSNLYGSTSKRLRGQAAMTGHQHAGARTRKALLDELSGVAAPCSHASGGLRRAGGDSITGFDTSTWRGWLRGDGRGRLPQRSHCGTFQKMHAHTCNRDR